MTDVRGKGIGLEFDWCMVTGMGEEKGVGKLLSFQLETHL